MFEGIKTRFFEWATKSQIQAQQSFIRLLMSQNPTWTNWTTEAAVNEGYKASIWVYAAINKKAKAAASVPWYVYKRNSQGEYEQQRNHPLQILIDKPNPFTSRNNLIERCIMQLELAGNSLYKMSMIGGVPVELWNIGPDGMRPLPDKQEFIKEYEYTPKSGAKVKMPANEILHVMYVDPANPFWGVAPLQVAARTVDTDIEAVNWNKVSLQNRAVTDGIFSIPQPLTTPQYNELRQQIREQHQGAANARTPWILGGGAQWQQMSLSPADMDFIAGRQMTREEICAIFSVPPPIVGILDKANYSNMQEARRVFWLDTIIPLLDDLKESFNRALTPYFGDDIELDYDLTNVEALAENVNDKIDAAGKLFSMGVPFNTINQRLDLGFDEIEGGDTGFLPASLMPANMAQALAAGAAAPPEEPNQDPEEAAAKKRPGRLELKGYNLQTPEQKAAYWKSFERQRAAWYGKVTQQAAFLFEKETRAIVKAFQKSGSVEDALKAVDLDAWESFYVSTYRAIIEDFGSATFNGFKSYMPSSTKDFNPWNNLILGYVFKAAADKVKHVTNYTKQLIKGFIYTGRDRGDSVDTIARDLKKNFDEIGPTRAYTIARTEVVAASNYGSQIAAEQAAVEVGDMDKEWIDSGDKRVRDSHEKISGERVGLYQKFSNGLEYPGDMRGPAKEVIKCRCTCIYHPRAYQAA